MVSVEEETTVKEAAGLILGMAHDLRMSVMGRLQRKEAHRKKVEEWAQTVRRTYRESKRAAADSPHGAATRQFKELYREQRTDFLEAMKTSIEETRQWMETYRERTRAISQLLSEKMGHREEGKQLMDELNSLQEELLGVYQSDVDFWDAQTVPPVLVTS